MTKPTPTPRGNAVQTLEQPRLSIMTPAEMLSAALMRAEMPSIEIIERLTALYERWQAAEAKRAFDNAMADAKAKFPAIKKTKPVKYTSKDNNKPSTDFKHEGLDDIAVIDPILSEFGLSWRHRSSQDGDKLTVTCVITHRDGYAEETPLTAGSDKTGSKNDIQAMSSAVTYLRRYTLKLALGLVTAEDVKADDDGKATSAPRELTPAHLKEIKTLCDETDTDYKLFARHLGAEAIEEIPDRGFEIARKKLLNKRKKRAEAQRVDPEEHNQPK